MNQLCPDLMFADDHDQELAVLKGIIVKPDVNVYLFKAGSKHRSHVIRTIKTIEMMIEFKIDPADDPFEDKIGSFERSSKEAEKTLGQIAVYATAHQAAQFRTRIFSGLVFPTYMRLLRWDRSGVVVTEKLPLDDPHVIIFFQRFSDAHSKPQLRGHDTTVAEASLAEDLAARIREKLSCQPNSHLLALSIGENEYIIAEPNGDAGAVAPTGRSTRCFRAYCMRSKRIVLLKDTWRVLWPTLKPEHETYETLHANGVQNIPQCFGGDVGVKDTNHRTQTKIWASRYQIKLTLREFQHYRLTLQHMDRTLDEFTDVHEMVTAVRDASEAHRQAVVSAKVLHRDISVGNIMITMKDGRFKGFLIDWDLCLDLNQEGEAQSERTGTWQFTAARLLQESEDGKTPVPGRVDDVESFLHVLTWTALRYTAHTMPTARLSSALRENYETSYTAAGKRYITTTRALNVGSGDLVEKARFANEGILTVLQSLLGTLCHRYKVPRLTQRRPTEDDIKEHEFAVQRRTKALKLLDDDDAWLPTLLTDHLDDEEIRWEPNHQKVVHEIETLTENGGKIADQG